MLYLNESIKENQNELFFIFQNDYFIPCIEKNELNIDKLIMSLNVINKKNDLINLLNTKVKITQSFIDICKDFNLTIIDNDNLRKFTLY